MGKLRVESFSISLDGFGAGPGQSIDSPLGRDGNRLHQWLVPTAIFQQMLGVEGGTTGIDNDFASRGFRNIGSWIMGRNMFGPIRGPWPDRNWRGWWGDNPPYHTPVFILSNYTQEPMEMEGGTTFHFVADGIHAALARAKEAANGSDVRVGGGVDTIRQYLREGLIDELHIAMVPILLGSGESLFADLDMQSLGYQCVEHAMTDQAMHVVLRKT
jgi:dihydrofolate reductase